MKKLLFLPLIFLLIFAISCNKVQLKEVGGKPQETSCILVIGLDDAAQNMDVLCFMSYREGTNEFSFVQIPRDTYFNFGGTQNKINQLFSFYRANEDYKSAMSHAANDIIHAFGVRCDGYLAITTNGLKEGIDALGGVDIDVLSDSTFTDEFGNNPLTLKAGTNHLDGKSCVQFIRYRKGYATGDLGRMDAQKLFFRAILSKFASRLSSDKLISAFLKIKNEVTTDLDIIDIIRMSNRNLDNLADANVNYLTIPGEAAISQRGLSYYALNKKGAKEVLQRYLSATSEGFDPEGKFLKQEDIIFQNIYEDKNNTYRVYDNDSLSGIHIPKT